MRKCGEPGCPHDVFPWLINSSCEDHSLYRDFLIMVFMVLMDADGLCFLQQSCSVMNGNVPRLGSVLTSGMIQWHTMAIPTAITAEAAAVGELM